MSIKNSKRRKRERQKSALARLEADIKKYSQSDKKNKLEKAMECAVNLKNKFNGLKK